MKGNRIQSLHFGKRGKGRYFEEYDWSSCSIDCPIKIVYISWQSKAAKTWGWLKCCNLIGSPAKRRYFQIRKSRVIFTFAFSLGTLYFDQVCFSFRTLTVVFFIRSVLLLIFNFCIDTELYRVEFTEQQLLCWKKLDQFRWVTTMWSPPVCSRSVTTLVLSVFPSQIGITQRCWYRVTVSSFHKTQVFFPFRKDMFFKGNR